MYLYRSTWGYPPWGPRENPSPAFAGGPPARAVAWFTGTTRPGPSIGALTRSLRAPCSCRLRLLDRKGGHTLRQRCPRASSSRSAAALLVAKPLAAHLNCCAQPGVASARTPLGSRAISADAVRIWALDRRYNRVTIRLGGHDAEEKVERTSRQPLYVRISQSDDGPRCCSAAPVHHFR